MWQSGATEMTSTEHLIKCLLKAELTSIATELKYKNDDTDIESFLDMERTTREKIIALLFDLLLPFVTIILTIAYMACLCYMKKVPQFVILAILHWFPSGVCYGFHLFFDKHVFGSAPNYWMNSMLLACYPVSSILLHMKYFKMRRVSKGTEIEKYQMNKTMREANASMMINNFTSLLVIIFTLHTTVTGSITEESPALLSLASVVTVLHLLKLLGNNLKNQGLLGAFSVVGSLALKMGSLLSLLSSDSNPAYLVSVSIILFLLAIAVNWWIEKRLITGEIANDEKKTFLRAAHSLIFPSH